MGAGSCCGLETLGRPDATTCLGPTGDASRLADAAATSCLGPSLQWWEERASWRRTTWRSWHGTVISSCFKARSRPERRALHPAERRGATGMLQSTQVAACCSMLQPRPGGAVHPLPCAWGRMLAAARDDEATGRGWGSRRHDASQVALVTLPRWPARAAGYRQRRPAEPTAQEGLTGTGCGAAGRVSPRGSIQ